MDYRNTSKLVSKKEMQMQHDKVCRKVTAAVTQQNYFSS